MGAPLEDARHLTHRYQRIRRDVEAQVFFLKTKYTAVVGDVTLETK